MKNAISNDTPIIGILSLPCYVEPHNCPTWVGYNATSYIPASYVKWIEGGGGRVVPILYNEDFKSIRTLISQLNGVLFTGGSAYFGDNQWYNQVNNIINYLRDYHNESGTKSIPLWGTCLGFEALVCTIAKSGINILTSFDATDLPLTILFTNYGKLSRIFNSTMPLAYSNLVYNDVSNQNITMNDHVSGFSTNNFINDIYLNTNFSIIGNSYDRNNNEFISLIESKNELGLSWYASAFHPEKPQYEFNDAGDPQLPHTLNTIISNQYFSEFFVNECRYRNNNIMDSDYLTNIIIYNYIPYYIDQQDNLSYEQVYLFQ